MTRKPREFQPAESLDIDSERTILGVNEGSSRLEFDGVTLAWEESGAGTPVICLHAAGHGSRDFSLLQREHPQGCRLYLLDWPGHGRSSADKKPFTVERCVELLAAFLDAQGLRSALLAGTEFGATVAVAFAIRHSERVRGLVLCQPAGFIQMTRRRGPQTGASLTSQAGTSPRRKKASPAEMEQERVDRLSSVHAVLCQQADQSVKALEEWLRAGLARCACPVLIALAAKGRGCPVEPLKEFLAPLLSSLGPEQPSVPQLAIFAGQFSPLWQHPARMARALSGFVAATAPLESHDHFWTLAATDWPARGMNQWVCAHPACRAERALPVEQNPNQLGR
jgi:pimeloyl-ACP methyl ester carboxylesterase